MARWSQRDTFGQTLGAAVDGFGVADDRTLRIKLKRPFPRLLEATGKPHSGLQFGRLKGRRHTILAADLDDAELALARRMGAPHTVNARTGDVAATARDLTNGRGADVVLESAGSPAGFRTTVEAVRPGGEVIRFGKVDVTKDVAFRWGALMGEKRIRRFSYGGARPHRDFRFLARAALAGKLDLQGLITRRISLDEINDGFGALKGGEAIRSVVAF